MPDRALEAAQSFLQTEASSGIFLLAATVIALVWANSPFKESYFDFWHTRIVIDIGLVSIEQNLQDLVNHGLMTVFFFVVGLEIKRELVHGELADRRRAMLPVVAAMGGMIAPAAIYLALNSGGQGSRGWGIPMATDIAFAVGILSLTSDRVPFALKIFVLAFAIVDDIGSVVVVAIFYTTDLDAAQLVIALGAFVAIWVMLLSGVRIMFAYMLLAGLLWIAMLKSGVPATVAGAGLGLLAPSRPYYDPVSFDSDVGSLLGHWRRANADDDAGAREEILSEIEDLAQGSEAPLERLERALHPWLSFAILPLFALANAGLVLNSEVISNSLSSPVTAGIVLARLIGKPAGILVFSWLAVHFLKARLPDGATWRHMGAVSILGGIGFAVSLLIADLAFANGDRLLAEAKIGVLATLVATGLIAFLLLRALPQVGGELPSRRPRPRATAGDTAPPPPRAPP